METQHIDKILTDGFGQMEVHSIRVASEREALKSIVNRLAENTELPKAVIREVYKLWSKAQEGNQEKVEEKESALEILNRLLHSDE